MLNQCLATWGFTRLTCKKTNKRCVWHLVCLNNSKSTKGTYWTIWSGGEWPCWIQDLLRVSDLVNYWQPTGIQFHPGQTFRYESGWQRGQWQRQSKLDYARTLRVNIFTESRCNNAANPYKMTATVWNNEDWIRRWTFVCLNLEQSVKSWTICDIEFLHLLTDHVHSVTNTILMHTLASQEYFLDRWCY